MFGVPVGSYFAGKSAAPRESGLKLRVLEQGRVAAGGTGSSKCIGNYAGGIALAHPWQQKGYNDVMYLDSRHQRYITETSGSNIFVRLRSGKIVTFGSGRASALVVMIATDNTMPSMHARRNKLVDKRAFVCIGFLSRS